MKRFLRFATSVFIVLGLALALLPLGQIAFARWNQRALHQAWDEAASKTASRIPTRGTQTPRIANAKAQTAPASSKKAPVKKARPQRAAWPPTRIIIPDIGLDAVVVQGIDAASLERGPGHAPASALPGEAGNCALAAHRNVFGSWFLRVDELLPGSRITLKTPRETWQYEVMQSLSVPDNDAGILRSSPGQTAPQLTLITCTLPRTTSRIAVIASLVPPENGD